MPDTENVLKIKVKLQLRVSTNDTINKIKIKRIVKKSNEGNDKPATYFRREIIKKACEVLKECRNTIMYSYVFAFYLRAQPSKISLRATRALEKQSRKVKRVFGKEGSQAE